MTSAAFILIGIILASRIQGLDAAFGDDCTADATICLASENTACVAGTCRCTAGNGEDVTTGTCEQECPVIGGPTNGAVSFPDGITEGKTAIYTCGAGFSPAGGTTRTCTSGAWDGAEPTCAPDCADPTVTSSTIVYTATPHIHASTATVSCITGYTLSGGATITCTSGSWSALPTCEPNDCADTSVPSAEPIVYSATPHTHSSTGTVTCSTGYTLSGSATITCTAGDWGTLPTCEPDDCADTSVPSAEPIVYSATPHTHSSTGTVTCSTGYTLSGSATITCTAGSWGTLPTCEPDDCADTSVPSAEPIVYSATPHTPGSTATVTCSTGYTLSGSATITCAAGSWGTLPTCEPNDCADTSVPSAEPIVYSATPHTHSSTGTVTCSSGYTLSGSATITCTAGDWGTLPTCEPDDCADTAVVDVDTINYAATPHTSGSTATVTCNAGYTLSGSATITCTAGSWGTLPTCEPNDCADTSVPSAEPIVYSATPHTHSSTGTVTCSSGYTLSGSATITCTAGDWGTLPTCEPNDCADTSVTSAEPIVYSATPHTHSSTGTVTCSAGYTLSGSATITCTAGDWGTLPTCEPDDCADTSVPSAEPIVYSATPHTHSSTGTVTCSAGYTLSGSATITCTAGDWGTLPTCEPDDCADTSVTDGEPIVYDATPHTSGSTATVTCSTGFTLAGSATITCTAGSWSALPTCEPNDCTDTSVLNGEPIVYSATPHTSGSDATVTCSTGYTLAGSATITCTAGAWSALPTCEPNDCADTFVTSAEPIVYSATPHTHSSTGTVTCSTGYTLSGSATITCTAGSWDTLPTCEPNDCTDTVVPNGEPIVYSATPHTSGSTGTVTCSTGYTLSGFATITCTAESWSALPTCEPNDCGGLPDPTNGNVDTSAGTTFGETASYSCGAGYELNGAASVTCQATGQWSDTAPTCEPDCVPTTISNSNSIVYVETPSTLGSTATVTCASGYDLTGSQTITCEAGGVWAPLPTCDPKDCGALTPPTNGNADTSAGTTFTNTASYSCNAGHELNGATTVTCEATGQWSSTAPTCEPDCAATTITNSQPIVYEESPPTFGSTATVSCDAGYDINGSPTMTCIAGGVWDPVPSCGSKDCGALTPPTNGDVDTTAGTVFGNQATYSCDATYEVNGATIVTCLASGQWSDTAPTCEPDCATTTITNSQPIVYAESPSTFGSTATVTCDAGYDINGSPTMTCIAGGAWDSVPTCDAKDCGALTDPTNGNVDTSAGTMFGDTATYSCNANFELNGAASVTCEATGQWSDTAPTCEPDCTTVTIQNSLSIVYDETPPTLGSAATVSCAVGYVLAGSASITCMAGGTWSTLPTCDDIDCGALANPADGTVTTNDGTTLAKTATYTCDAGHTLNGVSTRECQPAGTWSNSAPTCEPDCPTLPNPTNGGVSTAAGTAFEDTAQYSCLAGYDLIGTPTRECLAAGQWSSTAPTCQIKDCGSLVAPSNGGVDTTSGTEFGDTATYSCNTGYTLGGSATRTCQDTGTWSNAQPTCTIKDCGNLQAPTDGGVTYNPGTQYQGVATFECNTGYTLNGASDRTCVGDGTWDGTSPTCVINDCGTPTEPTNGNVDLSGGLTYQSVVTFSCDAGYTLAGATSATCQADKSWSQPSPTCTIKDCGTLTSPTNGLVDLTQGTEYGDTAVFSCDTGYTLVGKANVICLADGNWDSASPTCQIKDCNSLSAPANGSVATDQGTTYGQTAVYSCDAGFQLNGGATRECGSDGQWAGTQPSCDRKDCGTLSQPTNGGVDLTGGTLFQDVATFSCYEGYTLTGSETRTCLDTGLWGSASPTCVIKNCGILSSPSHGNVATPSGTTYGAIATYSCDTGYSLNGLVTRSCQGDGTWSGDDTTCTIKDCGLLSPPSNGLVSLPSGVTYGAEAVYTCNTGYEIIGTATRVCLDNALWSNTAPICDLIDCGTPAPLPNGIFVAPQGTKYGATITYTCNTNFGLVGNAIIACESSGFWASLPVCEPDCGVPDQILNGAATYTTTLKGTTAIYTCNDGYQMSGGASISCQTDGTWSTAPSCQLKQTPYASTCDITAQCVTSAAVCRENDQGTKTCQCSVTGQIYDAAIDQCLADCGGLPAPTNGHISLPSVTSAGQIATYSCDVGYALSGVSTRTCLSTGIWAHSAPTCVVGCSVPTPPTNGIVNVTDGLTAGRSISYACNEGYTLVGDSERICLGDTTWNGNEPICSKECPPLVNIKHGYVDSSKGNWQGSISTYVCDKDYALVGSSTRTCQPTGLWSGGEPDCIFAIFPDVLLVFGSMFAFLILVDIFILGFCIYLRYCNTKKKPTGDQARMDDIGKGTDEENRYPDILDEKPDSVEPAMPPTAFAHSYRKARQAKIAPEIPRRGVPTTFHPLPRRPPGPRHERFFQREPKPRPPGFEQYEPDSARSVPIVPLVTNPPPSTIQQQAMRELRHETTHDLQVEDLLKDGYQTTNSEESTNRKMPSEAEEDQISLTHLADPPAPPIHAPINVPSEQKAPPPPVKELEPDGLKSKPVNVMEEAPMRFKGRMSFPPVPDPPISADSDKLYTDETRRSLKNSYSAYSPIQRPRFS